MKSTDFSPQFSEVWGANASTGTITYPIPETTTTSGRASLDVGFSSVNMTALAAGGIPPFGQDFNGILKMLSTSAQNYEAGNIPVWSSDMATNISGYPEYALVQYGGTYYVSTSDGNITTPGATGSSWKNLFDGYVTGTTTANVGVTNLEAVNFTGTDNSAALMRVETPAGTLDLPSETNVLDQLQSAITSGRWLNRSNNTPGFTTLPGGWILQSGTAYTASSGLVTIDFPITFPNMCIAAFTAEQDAAGTWFSGSPTVIGMTSRASNQVTMYGMAWNNGSWVARGNISAGWYAIGY